MKEKKRVLIPVILILFVGLMILYGCGGSKPSKSDPQRPQQRQAIQPPPEQRPNFCGDAPCAMGGEDAIEEVEKGIRPPATKYPGIKMAECECTANT